MAHRVRLAPIAPWADTAADTRWLSYDELAEIAGIKRDSVTRMVRRKKWPKRTGNEPGSVRVAVPLDAIEDMQARKIARPVIAEPPPPELPAPELPAPELPAPELPAPELPAPELPPPEAPPPEPPFDLTVIALAVRKLETALHEVRAERDQLRVELERERATARLIQQDDELTRMEIAEERLRTADQRARLNAQIATLAGELARLHAVTRSPVPEPEPAATPAPLLGRVGSITRWFRS